MIKEENNEQRSWLVRVHQKINTGMADKNPRLEWLRSKFGIAITSLLIAVFVCNWYVIYGTTVEEMPDWLVQLALWVVDAVPGAAAHVQHSWYLRDIFPYIYTVNFIFSVSTFFVTVVTINFKQDQPFINIARHRDIVNFHFRYLVMLGLSSYFVLIFYCGLGLEPVFEAKPLPQTAATGAAIPYRMYETPFGVLSMYSLLYGWGMPLLFGLGIYIVFRWYLSAFRALYTFLFKKEF